MEIIKTEDLHSTTNAWGFGGSTNKKRFIMSNGDVWVTGRAQYRHMDSEKYIQMKPDSPDFTGGLSAKVDVILKTSPEKFIKSYYENDWETIN